MFKLLKRIRVLLEDPEKIVRYACYIWTRIFKGSGTATIPFKGKVHTGSFSEYLSVYGLYPEANEVNLVSKCASDGSCLFDVGANVGVWTVMMSLAGKGESEVHSFEPNPATFSTLEGSVLLNKCDRVHLNNVATGSSEGSIEFQVPKGASIFGRVSPSGKGVDKVGRFDDSDVFSIKSIKLDDYCADKGIDYIDFMKIDVEGYELEVMKGMDRMLREKRVRLMWMETMEENHVRMGVSYSSLVEYLNERGYDFYTICEDGTPGVMVKLETMEADNHLCLPREVLEAKYK